MRKFMYFIFVTFLALKVTATDANVELEKYTYGLINEASDMLSNKQLTEAEKVSRARDLLSGNLALEWMAKYTLGRYKRTLSSSQINEFVKVYSNYVIDIYSGMAKNYKGQKAAVIQSKKLDDTKFIVKMQINQPNGQRSIKVDYLVLVEGAKFKVGDIITEGVSMINSQQDEFGSVISGKGFDYLLKDLAEKSS